MQSHEELKVWQQSVELATNIYTVTEMFPAREMYGITAQMRRAVVSIASNIAEGRRRGTDADFCHFLRMAHGSLAELETQLLISENLSFCSREQNKDVREKIVSVSKMLHAMIKKLS